MTAFDYSLPAEIYASRGGGARSRPITFYRFDNAADAIAFVIEQLPGEMQLGTVMEIGEDRFTGDEIRRLYGSDNFPRARVAKT